jgi:transketolase C-terminal domain/subunit
MYESIQAAELLEAKGYPVTVIDMPSIDENLILELYTFGQACIYS